MSVSCFRPPRHRGRRVVGPFCATENVIDRYQPILIERPKRAQVLAVGGILAITVVMVSYGCCEALFCQLSSMSRSVLPWLAI